MHCHTLIPHPQCAQSSLGQHAHLTVQLTQTKQHWQLRYLLEVDPARLRWPAPHPTPGPTDGLWQHTCFELFVGQAQNPAYLEPESVTIPPAPSTAPINIPRCLPTAPPIDANDAQSQ